jgi:hypothetical protein
MPVLQAPSDTAKNTQDKCFKMMYRDVNAYSQCLRNIRDEKNNSAEQRLGAAYFGFVGGLSYMRLSHVNASQIANEFLKSYEPLQKNYVLAMPIFAVPCPEIAQCASSKRIKCAPRRRRPPF